MTVPFQTLPFYPLFAGLAALAAMTVYYGLRLRARPRPARSRLYRCPGCGHVYEDRRNVPLAACGHCGRLNESVKR